MISKSIPFLILSRDHDPCNTHEKYKFFKYTQWSINISLKLKRKLSENFSKTIRTFVRTNPSF